MGSAVGRSGWIYRLAHGMPRPRLGAPLLLRPHTRARVCTQTNERKEVRQILNSAKEEFRTRGLYRSRVCPYAGHVPSAKGRSSRRVHRAVQKLLLQHPRPARDAKGPRRRDEKFLRARRGRQNAVRQMCVALPCVAHEGLPTVHTPHGPQLRRPTRVRWAGATTTSRL